MSSINKIMFFIKFIIAHKMYHVNFFHTKLAALHARKKYVTYVHYPEKLPPEKYPERK